ncbi:uncharacterized [Tachysurus ichikawai]
MNRQQNLSDFEMTSPYVYGKRTAAEPVLESPDLMDILMFILIPHSSQTLKSKRDLQAAFSVNVAYSNAEVTNRRFLLRPEQKAEKESFHFCHEAPKGSHNGSTEQTDRKTTRQLVIDW